MENQEVATMWSDPKKIQLLHKGHGNAILIMLPPLLHLLQTLPHQSRFNAIIHKCHYSQMSFKNIRTLLAACGCWLLGNCADAFLASGCAWLRGNMAHRALHIPAIFLISAYSFSALFLSVFVALSALETVNCNNVFSASHTATAPVAVARDLRYLLYDVNPPEGFNLRRDVYIRMASLVKTLRKEGHDWVLVLPPWGRLYHWQSPNIHQIRIPWGAFFSLTSLQANVPVIEYEEFIAENGGPFIDQVLVLQNYAEGWTDGKWEEKVDERPCIEKLMYSKDKQGYYRGWFWGYEETRARNVTCISAQGHASIMAPVLQRNITAISVMLDRAETLLHDHYAGKDYWDTRRSMVFAKHLRMIGDDFRAKYLNSTDDRDHTVYSEDWTRMKAKPGSAKGGSYLGVHLRRKDFIWGHREDVPSLKGAVKKMRSLMKKHKLDKVFVATDADDEELKELKRLLPDMVRYEPSAEDLELFKDGGVAIIDQWICAHARFFIGTSVSTFSFRIHEEREILGFDPKTTYNRFCGDNEKECEQPTHWKIVY